MKKLPIAKPSLALLAPLLIWGCAQGPIKTFTSPHEMTALTQETSLIPASSISGTYGMGPEIYHVPSSPIWGLSQIKESGPGYYFKRLVSTGPGACFAIYAGACLTMIGVSAFRGARRLVNRLKGPTKG